MSAVDETVVIQIPDSAVATVMVPKSGVQSITVPGGFPGGGGDHPIVDWFTGIGPPPAALIGAGPGDMYIDLETGTLYQLR